MAIQFSVIYSVDVPSDERIMEYNPPPDQRRHKLWAMTEDDKQYDYDYLGGRWATGKHRKWCALLDRHEFEEFLHHCNLYAEDVETMGSLGAPGLGYGLVPAISFQGDDYDAFLSAYVTPFPDWVPQHPVDERSWERLRRAIIRLYS